MAFTWKRELDDIAIVLPKKKVPGMFTKAVVLSPNEKAVLIKNGVVEDLIEHGKLKVGGALKPGNIRKDVDVALMDTSEKEVRWHSPALWTNDGHEIGCSGILRFMITDTSRFFKMLMSYTTSDKDGIRTLSVSRIYDHLESETITRVLEPEVHKESIESIYGDRELQLRMEIELEMQLKSTLLMWGLELSRYTVEWDFKTYEAVRQKRGNFQTTEELREMETLEREGQIDRDIRMKTAQKRGEFAGTTLEAEHLRQEAEKDALHRARISEVENLSDAAEARQAIGTFSSWRKAKTSAKRDELELTEDVNDRNHSRDMEYMKAVMDQGGAETANVIAQGREFGNLSAEQIAALAKLKEADKLARDDRVEFMKEIEDREREDSYRHKELDADIMAAAQSRRGPGVRKCPGCGSTVPAEASFCSQCGMKLVGK